MKNPLRHPSHRWWAAAGVTAIAAAGAIVFGPQTGAQASAPASAPPAVPVSVAAVAEREVTTWDEFSGRLEAVERVEVRSRVAGAVQSVHFREGAIVNKGDLLVTIDPAPYAAEVERAEAQVAAAQARLTHATNEHARAKRLWEESAIAQREVDERVNGLREAEANVRAAQAQLQAARLSLSYTQVRAPVTGRIGKVEVTAGNLVAAGPGAPVLAHLVSVSPIYASFDADEQTIVRALRDLPAGASARQRIEGIPVRMDTGFGGEKAHDGRLQLIDNQVDPRSGTIRVRAAFDNRDGALIPGQFARIRMGQPRPAAALLVSERAVGTDQDKKFVLVVGDDNKAQYREVALGAPVDGLRVVRSGLKAGERIVVNGLQRVRPGAVVQPQVVEMTARAEVPVQTVAAK
jgi:multidrug efflux system membrane fusion protein